MKKTYTKMERGAGISSLSPVPSPLSPFPAGSTLTEVLVSLMIMSIGIVSLATMFPISVLRSVKASQLTHGSDLRWNAEQLLSLYSRMVKDPDNNGTNYDEVDSSSVFIEKFVIDPLGWWKSSGGTAPTIRDYYGNVSGTARTTIPRYNGLTNSEASADFINTLPDSWVVQYEGTASNITPGTGGTQLDVSGLSAVMTALPSGVVTRAVLFDSNQKTSQVRTITQLSGNTIYWTEDLNGNSTLDTGEDKNYNNSLDNHPLPSSFTPVKVRIESQERRYTWLLTVRDRNYVAAANSATMDLDVVIFFRRFYDETVDDLLYDAKFTLASDAATVTYTAGSAPKWKAGSYVFDADNARWYRIRKIDETSTTQATLKLEESAKASSPTTGGKAMFPRAVVEVYPLGTRTVQ